MTSRSGPRSARASATSCCSSGAPARSQGLREEDAFFVRCDRTTMTQADIDAGRLICLIGVAPVKPAEFVIFRISQFTANDQAEGDSPCPRFSAPIPMPATASW